jgi:AP-2 complex subunit beta-1
LSLPNLGTKLIYRDLLADQNPTVVANAVAALIDISERSDDIELRLNATVAGKLIAALGECSEYVTLPERGK